MVFSCNFSSLLRALLTSHSSAVVSEDCRERGVGEHYCPKDSSVHTSTYHILSDEPMSVCRGRPAARDGEGNIFIQHKVEVLRCIRN